MNKMLNKLAAPALVALAAEGCMLSVSPKMPGADCETKECVIEAVFGRGAREGVHPEDDSARAGAVLLCESGPVSAEEVRRKAERLFSDTHGCDYPKEKRFDTVEVRSHQYEKDGNTTVNVTCAYVNDTDLATGKHCRETK